MRIRSSALNSRCLDTLRAKARTLQCARRYSSSANVDPIASNSKFQNFFFHHPTSPRGRGVAPQSTAVQVPEDDRRGIDLRRGADMSRFPVLLPLPSEEELATFKMIPT